jgi:hypothetical protein
MKQATQAQAMRAVSVKYNAALLVSTHCACYQTNLAMWLARAIPIKGRRHDVARPELASESVYKRGEAAVPCVAEAQPWWSRARRARQGTVVWPHAPVYAPFDTHVHHSHAHAFLSHPHASTSHSPSHLRLAPMLTLTFYAHTHMFALLRTHTHTHTRTHANDHALQCYAVQRCVYAMVCSCACLTR